MMKNINVLSKRLLQTVLFKYHRGPFELPRQYNFKWTKQEKKILFPKRRSEEFLVNWNDPLELPGNEPDQIYNLFQEFLSRDDFPISAQNAALMMYSFTVNDLMTDQVFNKLMPYVHRNRGMFRLRSIFGCLYASIVLNKQITIDLFLEEYKASDKKFSLEEIIKLVKALNQNRHWTEEQKKQFWEQYLKDDFKEGIKQWQHANLEITHEFYDAFFNMEEFDDEIWDKIITFMSNRKGWKRIQLMEKLYAVSGTFQRAQQAFQAYYNDLSVNDQVLRRYNFEEMRFYTPQELFAIADQNTDNYYPKNYTLVPEDEDPAEWNRLYLEWLERGSIKQEEQIIKDKSLSFGFAIKDRYDSMLEDNVDLNTLSKEEFVELFGSYEIAEQYMKEKQKKDEDLEEEEE